MRGHPSGCLLRRRHGPVAAAAMEDQGFPWGVVLVAVVTFALLALSWVFFLAA